MDAVNEAELLTAARRWLEDFDAAYPVLLSGLEGCRTADLIERLANALEAAVAERDGLREWRLN